MRLAAAGFCCLFILLGVALIPYAGIENDEALFSAPIYLQISRHLFRNWVPLMVMSYVGTLKTWIYFPIFKILGVSVWSVRLPMVLTGALTVWFFFELMRSHARPHSRAVWGRLSWPPTLPFS